MEDLRIQVSLELAQAVSAMQMFIDQLNEAERQANRMGAATGKMETGLISVGASAQTSGGQFNQFNTQVNASVAVQNSLNVAVTNSSSAITNNTTVVNNNAAAVRNAASDTGHLITKVEQIIAAYAGYQALNKIMDEFLKRKQEELDLAQELAKVKLGSSEKLEGVMNNLGVQGASGQRKARQLQQEIMRSAPVGEDEANSALKIANSNQHDPRTSEGMKFAIQVAYLQRRLHLTEQATNELVKTLGERGIDTTEGLKLATAKNSILFRESASTHENAFLRGYTGSVLPEVANRPAWSHGRSVFRHSSAA